MKLLFGLLGIVSLAFATPAYWGFTGWLPVGETDFSKADVEYYSLFATPNPCSLIAECERSKPSASGGVGSYTDSKLAEAYWEENRPSFSANFPRAFVKIDGCKWFNTIKQECEGVV